MANLETFYLRMVPDGATVWLALRMNVFQNLLSLVPVEVLGVFADENDAVKACETPYDVCGPVAFNKAHVLDEKWEGAYYPRGKENE